MRVKTRALVAVVLGLAAVVMIEYAARADQLERTDVYTSGTEGYHTFRIPAVIATPGSDLLAFCEGRKNNRRDHGDIDLVVKRSTDGGRTWSPLEIVYEEGGTEEITIGNPCPVVDKTTGTIWLPFCRNNDDVLISKSTDDGVSWSEPVEITADVKQADWGWYATGPGVGIQLTIGARKGRLLIPCDHREPIDGKPVMFSHAFFSDDGGATWTLGGSVEQHTDECQAAELSDGTILINMRNYWGRSGGQPQKGGMRAICFSRDGGESWLPLRFDETLIEPVCQASLIRYGPLKPGKKATLLFSNPASKSTRHRLTVRLSEDEGKTWPVARELHAGPSAYSCLVGLPEGSIGCLFEGGREHAYEKIIFARFDADWLRSGE